jgi:hypothetical protein
MTATAETPKPMSFGDFYDAMVAAGESVGATEINLQCDSNRVAFTCRYSGHEFSLSFRLPFEKLSERYKQHAIEMVLGLPPEWRPWRPK